MISPAGFAFRHMHSAAKEEMVIIHHCILNRIPYKICRRPEDRPEGFIPVGTVEWCSSFLPAARTTPDYYPDFLSKYLFRKVWWADKWPMEAGVFVKPADRHKRFNGFVTHGGYRKKKKPPYWCSEAVQFTDEWRYYVADGQILTGEWYSGDEVNEPAAPALSLDLPPGYCGALDFGRLTTGEIALVEAQPPFACGWYGKDNALFVRWIVQGWKYLTTA